MALMPLDGFTVQLIDLIIDTSASIMYYTLINYIRNYNYTHYVHNLHACTY